MKNVAARLRRAKKIRAHIARLNVPRLSVHKTLKHFYAQLIAPNGNVLAAASTVDKQLKESISELQKKDAAKEVGKLISQRIKEKNIDGTIAFDRSGFTYCGRVAAFAEAVREAGIIN